MSLFKPEKIDWFFVRPWGRIGVSEREGNKFVHAESTSFFTWSNIGEARDAYDQFISQSGGRVYSVIPHGDKKLERFQRFAGLEFLKDYKGHSIWVSK